jgi:hypothetical protein
MGPALKGFTLRYAISEASPPAVRRPKNTVAVIRAQDRPPLLAHAIQSHKPVMMITRPSANIDITCEPIL